MGKRKKTVILICKIVCAIVMLIIIVPLLINYFVQRPACFPIVGDPINWLMFWPTYLGAAASFLMVLITYLTLEQNKKQLDVLKKQWDEEHKPLLSAHLFGFEQFFYIRIKNISKVAINNISISVVHDPQEPILNYNSWKMKLSSTLFHIEPFDYIDIELPASFYRDGLYGGDYLGLALKYQEEPIQVNLYFDEATIYQYRFEEQALINKIDNISKSIDTLKLISR